MIKSKLTFILTLFSLTLGFLACNLISIPSSEPELSAHGQVVQNNVVSSISTTPIDGNIRFFLTDAPLDDVAEVNITVTELRIKKHIDDSEDEAASSETSTDESSSESTATDETSADDATGEDEAEEDEDEAEDEEDSEWVKITFEPARVIDLKKLSDGLTDVLGDLDLPTGVYKEIRLHVTESEVVLNDGTKETLKIPSGESSGLKIKFKGEGVSIEEGKKYALVLDFDLEESLTKKADKSKGHDHDDSADEDDEADETESSTDESTSEESSSDESTSTNESETEATDDESENESVEGSTWILKPVIRVSYLAEIDEASDSATVLVTDE